MSSIRYLSLLTLGLAVGLGMAAEGPLDPADPGETCFWVGPYTPQREETNVAFPDAGATYWSARFSIPEGAQLRLAGRFPHARYMSFVSYNSLAAPTDSVHDAQIVPDAGSTNPFVAGASREAAPRAYVLRLDPRAAPDQGRAANTLYAAPRFDGEISLLYRVYVPDAGLDADGGVGLPRLQLRLEDGRELDGEEACAALEIDRHLLLSRSGPRWLYRLARGQPWRAEAFPARTPPQWHAFYNAFYFQRCTYLGWCGGTPARKGGVYSNPDNGYLTLLASRHYGPLLVLEGRMPDIPRTRAGAAVMSPGQLRYWSLCSNETFTQRVADCVYDEQVPLDAQRRYTIVVSRLEDRPANARAPCDVAWLEWPAGGDGAGHPDDSLLLLRNLLPAPDFAHAVQRTREPGDARELMRDYLPQARYQSISEFELRGC